VRPTSAHDVSRVVQILAKSGMSFAVRGGGHSTVIGSANVADGVTLDMRLMDSIDFKQSENLVTAGAGVVWQQVCEVLDPFNVTTVGGRAGLVGLGGLVTGGMFSV
jgi:FAD/FMN-containing dehydrogenase